MKLSIEQLMNVLENCPGGCGEWCPYYQDAQCNDVVDADTLIAFKELLKENRQLKAIIESSSDVSYWVIKNPDTGFYFRGKGVNRWGKYLNQASIYRVRGQVEESCDWINREHRNGERAVIIPIKIIEENVEI